MFRSLLSKLTSFFNASGTCQKQLEEKTNNVQVGTNRDVKRGKQRQQKRREQKRLFSSRFDSSFQVVEKKETYRRMTWEEMKNNSMLVDKFFLV